MFADTRVGSEERKANASCTNVLRSGVQPQSAHRIPSTCAARE
ncbi:MAG TPA: hypothetical protein VM733_18890 [Thermoanaerobaculia bacterium]|nr:hypothetical protein [Thermoanaerobaculia bacterium]